MRRLDVGERGVARGFDALALAGIMAALFAGVMLAVAGCIIQG